mgnify:CR=1 FL=1
MDIRRFDVLKPCDGKASPIERMARVIWMDKEENRIWLFFIEKPYRAPILREYTAIISAINAGGLSITSAHPAQIQHKALPELTEKEKNSMDAKWNRLAPLVGNGSDILLLERESRGRLLKRIAQEHDVTYQAVLWDLYVFWAYGGTPLAFVPRWYDCGPKGQIQQENQRKRGRRPTGDFSNGQSSGVALTPSVREKLLAGIKKFVKSNKASKRSYENTLAEYFSDGYVIKDGKALPLLDDSVPKPTFNQFMYLISLEKKNLSLARKLTSEVDWQLKNRPVLHRASRQTFGPCHRFEIDATVVDIYLVCSFNRTWIVGRPVLYVVIDVWSRAVVGFHLALEGPSWDTARYALFAAFTSKIALCAKYGREIVEDEWPCRHLSLGILGDRGEMISKASDELPRSLHIVAENTPPFRGDWKPFVEREFGLIQHGYVHFLPGAVIKPGKVKGMRDPRLNARLTIHELGQIIIECLLRFNRSPRNGAELPSEYLEAGHSVGTPIDVWKWGLENMTGALRRFDDAQVLSNLLPAVKASVKEDGIHFGGLRYTSPKAEAEEWMSHARMHRSFPVDFRVDTSRPREAWVRLDASNPWETCTVLDEDAVLAQSSSEDTLYKLARLTAEKREEERRQLQDDVQSTSRMNQIVDGAVRLTEQAQDGLRKSELLTDIKKKRKLESRVQLRLADSASSPPTIAGISNLAADGGGSVPAASEDGSSDGMEELVTLAANVWRNGNDKTC